MATKPLKSDSFGDLAASFDASEDEEFANQSVDGDLDGAFAQVDLNESDIDKAISAGFGASREDDERGKEKDDQSRDADKDRRPASTKDRDDDAEEGRYSERVRKRIDRERRLKAQERQARIEAERERDALKERVSKIEGKLSSVDSAAIDGEIQGFASQLDDLETKLAKASEDGEHGEIAKITRQLQEVAGKKIRAEERKAASASKKGSGDDDDETKRRAKTKLDRRAEEFIKANSEWWEDDAHIEDRKVIEAIDVAVTHDGYDQTTDDYYIELARRAHARGLGDLIQLPDWITKEDLGLDDDDHGRNQRRNGKPGPRRRGGPGGLGSGGERGDRELSELKKEAKGVIRLTQRDAQRMRQMRLDPNNKEHMRRWAEAKRESAREELARRG
jgi:hypothetical protein